MPDDSESDAPYDATSKALQDFMPSALAKIIERMEADGPEGYKAARELLALALEVRREEAAAERQRQDRENLAGRARQETPLEKAVENLTDRELRAVLAIINKAGTRSRKKEN